MKNQIKISIIVPIYNVSNYLRDCLDSLINQTLTEIEIICIDDHSTDNCAQIIGEYAQNDNRIKPLFLEENVGTCLARKRGVEIAMGDYIMFCDGDDAFLPQACQVVYKEMLERAVDILHFGTVINLSAKGLNEEYKGLENLLKPCTIQNFTDICTSCFHDHKFGYTLWNKAYERNFCQKAFGYIEETHLIIAEDLYTFFVLSYFAQSYRGIKEKLYIYNYGLGITKKSYLNLESFSKQVEVLNILNPLKNFLEKQVAEQRYFNYFQEIKKTIVEGVVSQWRSRLTLSQAADGYKLLLSKLGASTLVSVLARLYWEDQVELLRRLAVPKTGILIGKPVKRLGVYYHRLRNGGAEKVISELLSIWVKLGYSVILFTDEEPTEDDYSVPQNVPRIVLPSFLKVYGNKYKKRARYWESVIKKYDIDTIIYSSCTCHILFWDICLLKGIGCNVIIHTHSMFAGAMWYSPVYASYLPLIYRMVDCTVSLSRVDIAFWKNYCPAYYIQNPITAVPKSEMANLESHNILWVGRLAEEKQPFAILEAFKLVQAKVKDATLTIVGEGDSPNWLENLKNRVQELEIKEKVNFTGFQMDVSTYYKNASVLAFTSMCEAAPVVLSESKEYGVPIVMFELPNVEFARDFRGVIKVAQNDIYALANSLIMLLTDTKKRFEMGKDARKSIENFMQFDVANAWKNLFNDITNGMECNCDENVSIMLNLLLENINRGTKLLLSTLPDHSIHGSCQCIHEEVLQRHEEVVNRHEEVVNRHEEVINRHNDSINHQWEVQKWHEERIQKLEKERSMWCRIKGHIIRKFSK